MVYYVRASTYKPTYSWWAPGPPGSRGRHGQQGFHRLIRKATMDMKWGRSVSIDIDDQSSYIYNIYIYIGIVWLYKSFVSLRALVLRALVCMYVCSLVTWEKSLGHWGHNPPTTVYTDSQWKIHANAPHWHGGVRKWGVPQIISFRLS